MADELANVVAALGLEKYSRHIFLCADQTEPQCAPREQTLVSWEFLKRRLKELNLVGPQPLPYRSKVNCLRVCTQGPIAELPAVVRSADHGDHLGCLHLVIG